jgi:hypothetical protein
MTLSNMSDVTPFDRLWEAIRCWNAILEILAWAVYWLNPPFGKNVQFQPWAYEQWLYFNASFIILIDANCFNLQFLK